MSDEYQSGPMDDVPEPTVDQPAEPAPATPETTPAAPQTPAPASSETSAPSTPSTPSTPPARPGSHAARIEVEELSLRRAGPADLPRIAEVYLSSRAAAYPAMPLGVHPHAEVRLWVTQWDLAALDVWLAEVDEGFPLGYAVLAGDWLHSLYVAPEAAGQGIGGALLDLVKGLRPAGFCLWVFESNAPAREFYARRGLIELERTDGSANEERAPDIRMAWPGPDPMAYLRGLIDEVDEQLGDLLARRVALTRAVQPHKTTPGRDAARERAIVEEMARRAPELGVERVARIVDTIISESLDATS